jgi:predicted transcriptional regulator
MTIKLPDEIAQAVDALAKASGESADRIVISALRAHFPPVAPELLAEFEAWEQASEEDAARLDAGGLTA